MILGISRGYFLLRKPYLPPMFLLLLVTLDQIGDLVAEVGGVFGFLFGFRVGELAAEEGVVLDFLASLIGREILLLRPMGSTSGDFLFLLLAFTSVHFLAIQAFFNFLLRQGAHCPHL